MKHRLSSFMAVALLAIGSLQAKIVEVKTAGTLSTLLSTEEQTTCTSLTLKGKLNSEDIRVLRSMAGYREQEGTPVGRLEELDLSEARLVSSNKPFMTIDAAQNHLVGTALPARMVRMALDDPQAGKVLTIGFEKVKYRISSYAPCFILGCKENVPLLSVTALGKDWEHSAGNYASFMWELAEGDFWFAKGISKEQEKELKNLGLERFTGHELRQENGHYILVAMTQKGVFCHDTFYGCTSLRTVVLPDKTKLDGSVEIKDCPIKYIRK